MGIMLRHTLVNHFLEYSAFRYPKKIAIIEEERTVTYCELENMANKVAYTLIDQGVVKGDRVVVFMENKIESVVAIFASLKAGAVFVVINYSTKLNKVEFILNNSGAKAIIIQNEKVGILNNCSCPFLEVVIVCGNPVDSYTHIRYEEIISFNHKKRLLPKCIDLDLACIIYTSGSTGSPKGVMLSHRNIISAAHSITTYLENNHDDIIINMLPLAFDYGLYQVFMAFKVGGTIVLEKSFAFPNKIIERLIKEKVTGFPGVPSIFALLLKMSNLNSKDFRFIRYITNTAAALPINHICKLRKLFPSTKIYSMYGLTECKRVSYLPPEEIDRNPSSVGKGMPNQEVFIVNENDEKVGYGEVGELVVRGTNVMLGYWNLPEETAKRLRPGRYYGEYVLYTGDLFKMDKEGYLYFVARKDDIIKSKGEKISPKEVENVLYSLDGIIEAAVIGVPDEICGQVVKAYIVLDNDSKLTERETLKFCSQNLENYMIPRYLEIVDSLPKTATGKINKLTLN